MELRRTIPVSFLQGITELIDQSIKDKERWFYLGVRMCKDKPEMAWSSRHFKTKMVKSLKDESDKGGTNWWTISGPLT